MYDIIKTSTYFETGYNSSHQARSTGIGTQKAVRFVFCTCEENRKNVKIDITVEPNIYKRLYTILKINKAIGHF